jgi:mono/diheme cytochrome c family protein
MMRISVFVVMALLLLAIAGRASASDAIPTFNKDVAPILFNNCAECHRPNEIGPFSLLTFQDAKKRARQLADVTHKRIMPPWKPHAEWGDFKDARHLSDQQIAVFQKWLDAGMPEGEAQDIPPMPQFKDGWKLGEPGLVLTMPKAFDVPAEGPDIYRCFVIPSTLTEDRVVSAIEFRPGNRQVVHHALFYGDAWKQGRRKLGSDPESGFSVKEGLGGIIPSGDLGSWTPGSTPRLLPEGVGIPLQKGSDILMQVHYHPSGKPETDQSTVAVYFHKNAAAQLLVPLPLTNFRLAIPAGAERHRVTASFTMPVDVKVLGIQPHMHFLGREVKIEAVFPDGKRQPLIWIKDWNFNWQDRYMYRELIALPRGTRVECEAIYDNSTGNPLNPHQPPRDVHWGEATTDEMLLCAVYLIAERPSDYLPLLLKMAAIPGLARQWYFESPRRVSRSTPLQK